MFEHRRRLANVLYVQVIFTPFTETVSQDLMVNNAKKMADWMKVFVCRKQAEAEICPFKGPFSFTYAKGGAGAICSYPKSYMDSCQDPTKLQLSFQVREDEEVLCPIPGATWPPVRIQPSSKLPGKRNMVGCVLLT